MNEEQKQILWKILLLIAVSGKGQSFAAGAKSTEYQPGIRYADFQVVTGADIKKAQPVLNNIRADMLKIFQLAPSKKLSRAEERDKFLEDSQALLTQHVGPWCKDLPSWWFQLYVMSLHIKILSPDFKLFTLCSAKTLFNAIVKALDKGATLVSPVQLTVNGQTPLFVALLEAAIPPQLLAGLLVSETDEDVKAQCLEIIIYFFRTQALKFLSPLHEHQWPGFVDVSSWIDILSAAESTYCCYFQSDAVDVYAEKIVTVKLGELVNELLVAMANLDKSKTIEALMAIKSYYDSLPDRFQDMKIYIAPLVLYQTFYLSLLRSDEHNLKQNAKWYLAHLVPSYPTNHPVGFVVGAGVLNYVIEQIEQGHFELAISMLSSLPSCTQLLAYFGLLRKFLLRPQTLICFVDYYHQKDQISLLKAFFLQLAIVARLEEAVNTRWFDNSITSREALSLVRFERFLIEESAMELTELKAFLLKGFTYFQSYQIAGILWFIWVKSYIGEELLFTTSKQLGSSEVEAWFSQRSAFLKNPHQSGLVDEALAVHLFFSTHNIALLRQGDGDKITTLIKSLKPSMPKISEPIALQVVGVCPSFFTAKRVLAELLGPNVKDDILCIKLLINAVCANQSHILVSYAETTDKETIRQQITSPYFLDAFSDSLYMTANHILDMRTYQWPESFKALSILLTEEKVKFDLPEEESTAMQHMLGLISMKSVLLEPVIGRFIYLLRGKLTLLPPNEQKQFEQNGYAPTTMRLGHYLHLIHHFINLEEQDMTLAAEIAKGIYQTWAQINRKDRAQVRRFLLLLVDLINCINDIVAKPISPIVKQTSATGMIHNNYITLSTLINGLFYQLHQRGFDDDVGIISRLRDHRLRRDFISAHMVRLVLCENFAAVKKIQQHFKTQIDYAVNVNLIFEIESHLQNSSNSDLNIYFQTRKRFPRIIQCENSIDLPFKQIDKLSMTIAIIDETGTLDDQNIRESISVALKDQIDHCSEISVLTQSTKLFSITRSLIGELVVKGNLDCVQLAFETFDADKDLEISKEIINTAISRFGWYKEIANEKHTALKIIKLLLNTIGDGWDYFASQKIIDNRNGAIFSIITVIMHADMELFGLLYDFFMQKSAKPALAEQQATITPALTPTLVPQTPLVSIEQIVAASYQKHTLATTTISLARVQSQIKKLGLQLEGDIDKFIKGYLTQANSSVLNEMGSFAKLNKPLLQRERLFNASYFKGTQFVQDSPHFYPIRKSQVESYVYFNPADITGLAEPAPFQLLCERIRFVGRTGEGLKYISNLKIKVANYDLIEGGFEMKIHGSKERLLCYLAPSDHPDNPNIYVACLYLEDGLHGRIDPNRVFVVTNLPSFGVATIENDEYKKLKQI